MPSTNAKARVRVWGIAACVLVILMTVSASLYLWLSPVEHRVIGKTRGQMHEQFGQPANVDGAREGEECFYLENHSYGIDGTRLIVSYENDVVVRAIRRSE